MGTVAKALTLLDYFSRSRPEIGLSEFARLSGASKATVYRLLSDLQQAGFVEQTGTGRAYRLGPAFVRLASLREAAVPTREVAMGVLRRLSDATWETAHLSLLQGDTLTTLAHTYSSRHGTRVIIDDSEELPLHGTASGLAILAFSAPETVERTLTRPMQAFTDDTPTDPDTIRARLGRIRETGLAHSVGGFEADVHGVAVPLFNAASDCIGAVAVAAPVARMTDALRATIENELMQAAREIVELWGGFLPADLQEVWNDAG